MGATRLPQSAFGRAVLVWLLLALGFLLLSASLEGVLPEGLFVALIGAIFAAAPLMLLGVAFVQSLRRRMSWKPSVGLLGAIAAVVAAVVPLDYLSVRLNFLLHKPIYDSIVRDAMSGRQIGTARADGTREGVRWGVSYSFRPERPLVVIFPWKTNAVTVRTVEYRERPTVCQQEGLSDPPGPDPPTLCVEWPSLGDGYVFWQGII